MPGSKDKSNAPLRTSFSGTYGFRLQGWLRATDNTTGDFIHSGRPEIEQPVVMAGFQSPAPPSAPFVLPNPANPLPAQLVNSGYYPCALLGEITYAMDGSITGFHRLTIAGNTDGKKHDFLGNYQLSGNDGTYTVTDQVNNESATFAFVLVDGDKEIEFMDISSQPGGKPSRSNTAIGMQKRI